MDVEKKACNVPVHASPEICYNLRPLFFYIYDDYYYYTYYNYCSSYLGAIEHFVIVIV